jgi:3-hydroxyisobutyrate dehydrogenase-like beta-hydroxyacid dehydrogenase
MQEIGFVGLGMMGLPMARNLLQSGYPVRVFNRTQSKADELAREGAILAKTPEEAARAKGGIVITLLSNDAALEEVVTGPGGLVEGPSGMVHLSMSTISPQTSRRLAGIHAEQGDQYVAAPVFGRPDAVAARRILICMSGSDQGKLRVQNLLETIGQPIVDYGEDPGAANVVKLAGNFLIACATEALAECLALVEKNGIDRKQVIEMFGATLFACPIYQNYGRQIAEQSFEKVGFALPLGLKDLELVRETAARSLVPMPFAAIVRDRLIASLAKGREKLDWTAFALEADEAAGIRR